MKVAIIYDRVNKWGGAERVLLALHEIFPEAPLYTSVYSPNKAAWAKVFPNVRTTFLERIPYLKNKHEMLAMFMPIAFESFDFRRYDLVISVTSESAKGVLTLPKTQHVCYCLTPTRYLWSGYEDYFKGKIFKTIAKPAVSYLRTWDKLAAQRPDCLITISKEVQGRIKKYYDRESIVIYPPVEVEKISRAIRNLDYSRQINKKEYYLIVSRLVPYKKVNLAIEAFNKLGRNLVIVGTGSEERKLKSLAKRNIKFTGFIDDEKLISYLCNAKAFIHVQDEDFGIAAVEAQAAGTPVIAYKKGGVLESVVDGETGVFFTKQNSYALVDAVKRFARMEFSTEKIIKNAERFSKTRFKREIILELKRANIL